jgi:hypothetical protein
MNGSDTGVDWKAAVYRKVQDEMKTNRGLTVDSRQPIRQPRLQGLVEDAPDRDQPCHTIPRLRSKLAALLQRVAGLSQTRHEVHPRPNGRWFLVDAYGVVVFLQYMAYLSA